MTSNKVMLLIDADNVSADVMEQAVALLLEMHGALHVRRAYCTAESALKNQALFKRLAIRPMVNLAAGKNSTDIALAVDALDLVLAERPDLVAVASSDSDFAPLVSRLREKGCRVVGLGQAGKTGDETRGVYDEFHELTHRRAKAAGKAHERAHEKAPEKAPTKAPAEAPAAKTPAAKRTSRRKAAPAPAPELPDAVRSIAAALPELLRGETVELRVAAERLREAGVVGAKASPTKLLRAHPDHFELVPAKAPNQVRWRPDLNPASAP